MKKDIHPQMHPVIYVDSSSGAEFFSYSTLTTDEVRKVDGVDHYVISVEVSSASHPFYTGKRTLIDTAGRVNKFRARQQKAEAAQKANQKKAAQEEPKEEAAKEPEAAKAAA